MMRIHEALKAAKYPNCTRLAKVIEVSTRTIKRDVDFMKFRLDLPIEYDAHRYGYYYSKPVDQFPSVPVTEAEVFALLVAHKAIAQYHGTPFEQPLQAAFRKLTGQLNDQHALSLGNLEAALSFHPFAPDEADLETFQILSRALQEQRAVQFSYKNLGADKAQTRRVHPYHLACVENRWYLVAHDLARNGMRNFAMTRMRRLALLPERFTPAKGFRIEDYLKGSFGIFQAGDDFEVVVDFDKWAGELVRERKWHRSQQLTDLPGGGVRLQLRLNNLAEVERWILSWGTHATVVRPERLRESLKQTAASLLKAYAPVPNAG
jgi:proteasome accessory factor B